MTRTWHVILSFYPADDMMTFLTSFWCRLTNPAAALWAGVGTSSWLCPAAPYPPPQPSPQHLAPRTPENGQIRSGPPPWGQETGEYTLHSDILSSYIHIHPTTFNFKLQQAGSWSGRRSSWREFDVFHGTGLRTGNDIKQKTIDFILGKDYWRAIPSPIVTIFTNIKFYFRIKYGNFHTF